MTRRDYHARCIEKFLGPLWARWEGDRYLDHYAVLKKTQYDRPEQIAERQLRRLRSLVHHAYTTVPYYRQRFDEYGAHPNRLTTFDEFRRFPILTKSQLREQGPRLISDRFPLESLRKKKTSGSTGTPVEVYVDRVSLSRKRACTLRSDEWSGWRFGETVAKVWGNPQYLQRGWRGRLRNALLERARYLDTLQINERTLDEFARWLVKTQPSLLFGHAHSLVLLAEYVRDRYPGKVRPNGILSTAMVLHDFERQVIEEVFGRQVTNRYGCEEVSLIACECEEHRGLHVNADGVYVEVLDNGPHGAILVTDLTNYGMPIIRYQVGDRATLSDRRCPCGRGLPLIESLGGREADYVVKKNGEMISGISLTENFAVLIPGIHQLQIVQEELDRFLFRIVPGPGFDGTSRDRIKGLVDGLFGAATRFECEFVEKILPEPSGKFRFCISKVARRACA